MPPVQQKTDTRPHRIMEVFILSETILRVEYFGPLAALQLGVGGLPGHILGVVRQQIEVLENR